MRQRHTFCLSIIRTEHKNGNRTRPATLDGFLKAGDVARMDEKGYFYLVDREKDLILVSGSTVGKILRRDCANVSGPIPACKKGKGYESSVLDQHE